MMTSSFAKPARFGMRTCRSGLPPAIHAAVACVSAAEHPDVTSPHSAPRQRRQARADGFGELVEMHVLTRGGVHGRAHFRQHQRAADDRERAARVDERLDADRSIDVGRGAPRVLRGFGRRDERRLHAGERRQTQQRGEIAPAAQHIPAAEWLPIVAPCEGGPPCAAST